MTARPSTRRLALIVAAVVVAVDAASKAIAAHYLAGRGIAANVCASSAMISCWLSCVRPRAW